MLSFRPKLFPADVRAAANYREVWIRAFALLLTLLGGYYLYCAWNNDITFFRITIPGRLLFALGLAVFVALGLAKPILLLLGAVDTFGAIWTWFSLRDSQLETH